MTRRELLTTVGLAFLADVLAVPVFVLAMFPLAVAIEELIWSLWA